jgi:D-tyrosyl-tRNA(Tyr) deacylase
MIGLLQRVTQASVTVEGATIGAIGPGLLVLVGVQAGDTAAQGARLLERLVTYRVFADDSGRMNRSLEETGGGLLLVPQFTLAADTHKGTRPGFSTAAVPELGRERFAALVTLAETRLPGRVATGQFGADMRVSLVNDGPVTFWLEVKATG